MRLRESRTSKATRYSCEKRANKRVLCSDLVQLHWDEPGERFREIAILENLSLAGVGLFTGVPIPEGTEVRMVGKEAELTGHVIRCVFRENGYIVGLELNTQSKWAQQPGQEFVPQHLLDVSLLDLE